MKARSPECPVRKVKGTGTLSAPFAAKRSAANDPNRPNLLYIQTDQYRYDLIRSVQDAMPRYDGKTKIRTPNCDRLCREGVLFTNAYTQCAVCGPARSTFRTGNTVERHGVQSNDLFMESVYALDPRSRQKIEANETFEQILVEERGYVAEHFGKWHLPRRFLWSRDGSRPIIRYNDADFRAMTHAADTAKLVYGFDDSDASFRTRQKLIDGNYGLGEVEEPGMQRDTYTGYPYVTDAMDKRHGAPPHTANDPTTGKPVAQPDQHGRSTLPANRTSTYFEGTAAIGALERLAKGPEPFCLTASFHNPHTPTVAAGLYYDPYKALQDGMLLPDSLSGADMVNSAWCREADANYQDPVKVQEWMVAYYALCEEVDAFVGLLLDKLDEHGIADSTLVMFVSDHGEALGSHGMREKNTFLEESARVPLIMRFPGRIPAGTEVDVPVTTLDCFATTLDYLGAGPFDNSDGKSLRRYIENSNCNLEYDEEAIVTEWDFRTPNGNGGLDRALGGETNFLCRKGPWKLMLTKLASSTRLDMLYNIELDPCEMHNYVGNNGWSASDETIGKAEHLKCLMIEWMQRMNDDGGMNYYSDPGYNKDANGSPVGKGDIAEVTARRKWRTLALWVSDTEVEVGMPVDVDGQLMRNEYVYLGRTTPGTLSVSGITVQGADAGRFRLADFTSGSIPRGDFRRVKLTYLPACDGQPIHDARIVIRHDAGEDKVISLSGAWARGGRGGDRRMHQRRQRADFAALADAPCCGRLLAAGGGLV